MTMSIQLPEELAARVRAAASDRGISPDQVVAEAVRAQLRAHDALDAFIGVGASGDGKPFDIHEARRALAEGKSAGGT
jgi:predicted transcriptional regulator